MNKASMVACGIGSIGVVALVAGWWLTTTPLDSSPETGDPDPVETADVALEATATAVAQIAAESAGGDAVARDAHEPSEAPPGFVPGARPNDGEAASSTRGLRIHHVPRRDVHRANDATRRRSAAGFHG